MRNVGVVRRLKSAENKHEGRRLGNGEGITQGGNSAFSENRDQRQNLVNQE